MQSVVTFVDSSVTCLVYIHVVSGLTGTLVFFFFQAEDGIRDLVRSRGLGDVYKRQDQSESRRCPTGATHS